QVRSHGFHGYRLDVREDAGAHTRALRDLSATVGLGELDGAAIRRELAGRRPLHAPHVTLAGPTDETLRVFHVMRVIQDEGAGAAARRWRGRSPPCPRVRCTAGSRSPSRVRSYPRTSACPPSPSGAWS